VLGVAVVPTAALAAVAAVVLVAVGPRRVTVEGPSMEPTLLTGDRLIVVARGPGGRGRVRTGDLVALRHPAENRRLLVKRVVAVTGDEVTVQGDNRHHSTDSRDFGPVDRRALVGRVVYRYFPPGLAGPVS
jgi:nickel-type superoxide dismutase maturation protease